MLIHKKHLLVLMFSSWILSSCVVPPSLDSSTISSITPSTETTSNISSSSVENVSVSSFEVSSLVVSSSLDLKTYFQVVNVQKLFNETPKIATIQVRLTSQTLSKTTLIQGVQLIANDFYEANLTEIQTHRVNLTIQLFSASQLLTTTPLYGDALFVINESTLLIGIQLKEDRIVMP